MERHEAVRRLREARVGSLATVRPDGRPHVIPFVFALVETEGELRAYWAVDRKPKRSIRLQRLDNIRANPAVELSVDGYDDDWTALWWVRASGTAREVDGPNERDAALRALSAKYPRYASHPPAGPVVAIDVGRIEGWQGG
jgi:PPOX class probable F420-dependent enzyme